ncbi:hypothetical protein HELRODRAFT_184712 [Helobdella robusta]|uniref:Uncharacterized protein n=1 Tax=Helobdella robusta TaxID=6412 RepID=T1FLU2_HELRO|nr:hypothetical protein HELRODRAFT_184712 [Helobdella robusta]ESO04134.1 hypothetical protein HELRODRAFT_184712 [Helobdella robusta]
MLRMILMAWSIVCYFCFKVFKVNIDNCPGIIGDLGQEFDIYERYYYCIFQDNIHLKWAHQCINNKKINELWKPGLGDCIKYVFPCLLLEPFYHFFYLCDILKVFCIGE